MRTLLIRRAGFESQAAHGLPGAPGSSRSERSASAGGEVPRGLVAVRSRGLPRRSRRRVQPSAYLAQRAAAIARTPVAGLDGVAQHARAFVVEDGTYAH